VLIGLLAIQKRAELKSVLDTQTKKRVGMSYGLCCPLIHI
jgi:hypothetical protein